MNKCSVLELELFHLLLDKYGTASCGLWFVGVMEERGVDGEAME